MCRAVRLIKSSRSAGLDYMPDGSHTRAAQAMVAAHEEMGRMERHMRQIPVGNGLFTLVDDDMYDVLSQWRWRTAYNGYVGRFDRSSPSRVTLMHRFILQAPKELEVDHKNRNKLDNQRSNLRLATGSQNSVNREYSKSSSSRFRGVAYHKNTGKWQASIKVRRKHIYLGIFKEETDAARAYNQAALYHFGEFALLNDLELGM